MFGLKFAPHELINAVAGGLIGATISLAGAWLVAQRQVRNLRTLARFLEAALDADNVEIKYEDGEPRGVNFVMHAEPGSYGVQGGNAEMDVDKEDRK